MCDSVNLLKSPWVGRSWALKENCSVVLSYEYNVKLSYKYLRLYSQISVMLSQKITAGQTSFCLQWVIFNTDTSKWSTY